MKDIDESLPVAELASVVSDALEAADIDAVLSGGSVVTIYSDNAYESFDLDFVTTERLKRIEPVMHSLGFKRGSGRHFEHPQSQYYVEFPAGPLAIGDQPVKEVARLATDAGTVRILTPTQCVMDRLAAYYHWNDQQGLEQALLVARRHTVDIDAVKRWSHREGHTDKFSNFRHQLDS